MASVTPHPAMEPKDFQINGMVFNELEYLRNVLGAYEMAWTMVRRELVWKTEFVWQGRRMAGTIFARDEDAARGCLRNRSLNETLIGLYDMKGESI